MLEVFFYFFIFQKSSGGFLFLFYLQHVNVQRLMVKVLYKYLDGMSTVLLFFSWS